MPVVPVEATAVSAAPLSGLSAVSRAAAHRVLALGTVALTLLEVGATFRPTLLADVRAVLAAALLIAACRVATRLWVVLAVCFAGVGVAAILVLGTAGSAYGDYRAGALTVTPVVALLATASRLNAVVLEGRYNLALADVLVRPGRESWARVLPMYIAYALAPVLLAGALTQAYGPFQRAGDADHNSRLLATSVRAMSLALLWSPMGAPTAFALTLLHVRVLDFLAIAVPVSLVGLAVLAVQTHRAPAADARPPAVEHDPAKVLRLLTFLAALPVLVVVLAGIRGELSIHVVLTALVTVTLVWATLDRAGAGSRGAPAAVRARRGLAPDGVALYLSLGVFVAGVHLATGDGLTWVTDPNLAVALAFVGSAVGLLLGVHPVALIAVLAPTFLALDPHYAAVGAFALCAGAQAVNVSSPFSPLTVVGSQLSGRTPWQVSAPMHWRFSLQQLVLYGSACAVAAVWAGSS